MNIAELMEVFWQIATAILVACILSVLVSIRRPLDEMLVNVVATALIAGLVLPIIFIAAYLSR